MSKRIVLYSMGYRGDVLPFVPVGRALAERGHAVRFVCPTEFHALFEGEPFTCGSPGFELSPRLLDRYGGFVARWGTRLGGVMLPRLYLSELTVPHLEEYFEAIDAELAGADLLVSHGISHIVGGPAAQRRDVPSVVLDQFPMLMPSRTTPLPVLPDLGRRGNGLAWRAMASPRVSVTPPFRDVRAFVKRLGLDSRGWTFFDARVSRHSTIGLFSRHYVEPHADWPDWYHVAGFTPWLGPPDQTLPDDVARFLDDGPPPVLVTLGTNAATAHPNLFVEAAAALRDGDSRGLLLTSNDDVANHVRANLPAGDRHGVWPFVPLGPLLDRVAAVVHAGGIGTVGPVLLAGKPSLVRPAVTDQIWHGRRLQQLGVGMVTKRPKDLTVGIRRLVGDPSLRERASELQATLLTEDGPAAAADLVEAAVP